MPIRPYILATIALLAICACEGSVPGTDYMLTPSQVERDIEAAKKGDAEATKRLAFHFGLAGNKALSQQYLTKCITMSHPDCLAEEADAHFAKYMDRRTMPDEKLKYLSLAIRFNHQALISAGTTNSEKLEGYQSQGRAFLTEHIKLTNIYASGTKRR